MRRVARNRIVSLHPLRRALRGLAAFRLVFMWLRSACRSRGGRGRGRITEEERRGPGSSAPRAAGRASPYAGALRTSNPRVRPLSEPSQRAKGAGNAIVARCRGDTQRESKTRASERDRCALGSPALRAACELATVCGRRPEPGCAGLRERLRATHHAATCTAFGRRAPQRKSGVRPGSAPEHLQHRLRAPRGRR